MLLDNGLLILARVRFSPDYARSTRLLTITLHNCQPDSTGSRCRSLSLLTRCFARLQLVQLNVILHRLRRGCPVVERSGGWFAVVAIRALPYTSKLHTRARWNKRQDDDEDEDLRDDGGSCDWT